MRAHWPARRPFEQQRKDHKRLRTYQTASSRWAFPGAHRRSAEGRRKGRHRQTRAGGALVIMTHNNEASESTPGGIERDRTRALSRTLSQEKPTFHQAFVIFAKHRSQNFLNPDVGPARCLFIHTRILVPHLQFLPPLFVLGYVSKNHQILKNSDKLRRGIHTSKIRSWKRSGILYLFWQKTAFRGGFIWYKRHLEVAVICFLEKVYIN